MELLPAPHTSTCGALNRIRCSCNLPGSNELSYHPRLLLSPLVFNAPVCHAGRAGQLAIRRKEFPMRMVLVGMLTLGTAFADVVTDRSARQHEQEIEGNP